MIFCGIVLEHRISILITYHIFPNLIYKFGLVQPDISAQQFLDIIKLTLKCEWKINRPRMANIIQRENIKVQRNFTLTNFKT